MAVKKYLSLEKLGEYDELIKGVIETGDATTLSSAKSYVDTEVAKKANSSHTHDDRYYTETEIDGKLSTINTNITNITSGTTVVKKAEYATSAGSATTATTAGSADKAAQLTNAMKITLAGDATGNVSFDGSKDVTLTVTVADDSHSHVMSNIDGLETALAGKSDSGHNHDDKYDAINSAATALAEAKEYTNTKTSGMATTTVVDNKISAHNISSEAHNDIRDLITGLTNRLNTIANSTDVDLDQLAEIVAYIKNNKGLIDGITTSKVNVADIVDNLTTASATKVLSANQGVALKALIDGLQAVVDGKSDEGHSHTITADATDDDVIVLTGTNGTNKVTYDAKHATSGVAAGTYRSVTVNAYGHVTAGTNPTTLAGYGITDTYTKTQLDSALEGKADDDHKHTVSEITDLTASAAELNYMDGVTSNVQTQLDGKVNKENGKGLSTNDFTTAYKTKLDGIDEGANKTIVDTALSNTSTNPVQNKAVYSAIDTATKAIAANTQSINTHTTAITNLQTAVSEIQEITSEDIRSLFAN